LAKAVYVERQPNDQREEVKTHEAIVLRGGEAFSADSIEPFMQRIRAATARD
jgi:hypothetical protein